MAGFGGFMAGGIAGGFEQQMSNQNLAQFRQDELKLQMQAQQNQQQREGLARIDKSLADAMGVMQQTAEAALTVGHTPQEVSQAIAPMMGPVRKLWTSAGRDPAQFDAQVATMLAQPSPAAVEKKMAEAKRDPNVAAVQQSTIARNTAAVQAQQNLAQFRQDELKLQMQAQQNQQAVQQSTIARNTAEAGLATARAGALPSAAGTQQGTTEGSKYISSPYTAQQNAIIQHAGATPEQFDFDAVMYAYGNQNVAQGYRSYQGINPATILKARASQYWMDKGLMPQEANAVVAEFSAMKHGANVAAAVDARMTQALTKAENTVPEVLARAEKVDRTKYKDFNDFMVNVRKRTGNKEEIQLQIALETLAVNYGSSLGMGNSTLTDHKQKQAEAMLQQGWDQGQIGAAVEQIMRELRREEAGTRQGIRRFISGMQQTMEGGGPEPVSKRYIFNLEGELQ